jgi:hypothetical protein
MGKEYSVGIMTAYPICGQPIVRFARCNSWIALRRHREDASS